MRESPHYKELLQALNDCQVEYLIVGGYAVMKYTEPRYTKDLDVWVYNSPQNGEVRRSFAERRNNAGHLHSRRHRVSDRRSSCPDRYPDANHRSSIRWRVAEPDSEHHLRCSGTLHFVRGSHRQ